MRTFSAVFLLIYLFSIIGCASIPSKVVTLSDQAGFLFEGTLEYDGPYSGIITVQNGPKSESFTGRFIVVDTTSRSQQSGIIAVPTNQMPAVGSTTKTSSGEVQASGYWYPKGNKGSTMQCELVIGKNGHGKGACKHNDGNFYNIIL